MYVHTRFSPSNLAIGLQILRTVKCRWDGNCGYHSLINGICHLRGQYRTNTAMSASIFCQRCSTHVFYLRHFCFYTCTPLCTPVAQASVCVLAHYAKHHMDTCVGVLGSVCNASTLYLYLASGTPFLYRVHGVQASTAVQPVRSTHVHFLSPLM